METHLTAQQLFQSVSIDKKLKETTIDKLWKSPQHIVTLSPESSLSEAVKVNLLIGSAERNPVTESKKCCGLLHKSSLVLSRTRIGSPY